MKIKRGDLIFDSDVGPVRDHHPDCIDICVWPPEYAGLTDEEVDLKIRKEEGA